MPQEFEGKKNKTDGYIGSFYSLLLKVQMRLFDN